MRGCCAATIVDTITAIPSPVAIILNGVDMGPPLLSAQDFHHVLSDGWILRAHHRQLRDDFPFHRPVLLFASEGDQSGTVTLDEETVDDRFSDFRISVSVVDL